MPPYWEREESVGTVFTVDIGTGGQLPAVGGGHRATVQDPAGAGVKWVGRDRNWCRNRGINRGRNRGRDREVVVAGLSKRSEGRR